jgi:hypothetical protein
VRRIWPAAADPRSRHAVEAAERFADGLADAEELRAAAEAAEVASGEADAAAEAVKGLQTRVAFAAFAAANGARAARLAAGGGDAASLCVAVAEDAGFAAAAFACCGPAGARGWDAAHAAEEDAQAMLLADVLGNLSRPLPQVETAWLQAGVVSLAREIYAERAFERLPVLADALEDGGCGDAEILGHLRGPGPHALGCWCLDAVLGKS